MNFYGDMVLGDVVVSWSIGDMVVGNMFFFRNLAGWWFQTL